jgi:hypothetical protein
VVLKNTFAFKKSFHELSKVKARVVFWNYHNYFFQTVICTGSPGRTAFVETAQHHLLYEIGSYAHSETLPTYLLKENFHKHS